MPDGSIKVIDAAEAAADVPAVAAVSTVEAVTIAKISLKPHRMSPRRHRRRPKRKKLPVEIPGAEADPGVAGGITTVEVDVPAAATIAVLRLRRR